MPRKTIPTLDQFDLKPSTIRYSLPDLVITGTRDKPNRRKAVMSVFTREHGADARAHLQRFLTTGRCPRTTLRKVLALLGPDDYWTDRAISSTAEQIKDVSRDRKRWRADPGEWFRPYIYVRNNPNRRRMPVFVLAMGGIIDKTRIAVPADLPSRSRDEQLDTCSRLIRAFPGTAMGQLNEKWLSPPFGYAYRRTLHENWEFTPRGEFIEVNHAYIHEPAARLVVGPQRRRGKKGAR